MRTNYDLGKLVGKHIDWIENHQQFTRHHKRMFSAIAKCRTAALGGHVKACLDCAGIQISYNSCRNRNCPKCQGRLREKWVAARESDLIKVPYFHTVFTLPSALNTICLREPKFLFNILFLSFICFGSWFKQFGFNNLCTLIAVYFYKIFITNICEQDVYMF